jgi:hypothetical protein
MFHGRKAALGQIQVWMLTGFLAGWVLAACSASGPIQAAKPAGPSLKEPQAGLAVLYFHQKFRNISEMPKGEWAEKMGKPGKPIPNLDHRFGDGPVFDSGVSDKIGVRLTGFIHLAVPGSYLFKVNSNDGAEIAIDGRRVVSDPDVHSDRISDTGQFKAAEPGWYPFRAYYFENKKTATLQLFWKPPRAEAFSIVPADAFGHLPKG